MYIYPLSILTNKSGNSKKATEQGVGSKRIMVTTKHCMRGKILNGGYRAGCAQYYLGLLPSRICGAKT